MHGPANAKAVPANGAHAPPLVFVPNEGHCLPIRRLQPLMKTRSLMPAVEAIQSAVAVPNGSASLPASTAGVSDELLVSGTARRSSTGTSDGRRRQASSIRGNRGRAPAPAGPGPSQPAGLEHLERRLQRCQSLSAEERSPEAVAFLQAVQVLQQVPHLLPLGPEGRPPAPAPPLHQQALAFALAAAADSISPQAPPLASHARRHLHAYLAPLAALAEAALADAAAAEAAPASPSLAAIAEAGTGRASTSSRGEAAGSLSPAPGSLSILASLLVRYAAAVEQAEAASLAWDAAGALPAYVELAGLAACLAHPAWQAVVDAQLAELSAAAVCQQAAAQLGGQVAEEWGAAQSDGSALRAGRAQQAAATLTGAGAAPPLSAARLRFAANCALAELASSMLNGDRQGSFLRGLPASREVQLRAMAAGAGEALLAQAPDSPKACLLAAYCALSADGSFAGSSAARRRALQLYRRASELARQQRSDYFQVGSRGWFLPAGWWPLPVVPCFAGHPRTLLALLR